MKKKILSMLLVLLMVVSLVPTAALADDADNVIDSGYCGGEGDGTNLTWTLYKNGTLEISGTGKMASWTTSSGGQSAPWCNKYYSTINSIVIDAGVTSIGDCAFWYCKTLVKVTIPDSVTSIGAYALYKCTSLTSVTIPNSVAEIGYMAFKDCTSLLSIAIPDSVTEIGSNAFEGCSSLSSVELPNSLTSMQNALFKGCTSLTSMEIPDSVTSMGYGVFWNCSSLIDVSIKSDYLSVSGNLLFAGCTSLKSISLPKGSYYFNRMFQGCTSLENVNVASGIYASDYTFQGCTSLKSITLSASSSSIGQFAFEGCTSLETLNVPGSVSTIDNSAFSGCTALKSVSLPLSLKTIGNAAFRYCNSLADVYYEGDNVQWGEINIAAYNEPLTGAMLHLKEHVHSFGNPVITAPNCTEQGFTTRTCKCGETTTDTYVDALGHEYKNGVCSRCGEREAHTHDFVETVTAPTCTKQGYTTYTCSCGETYTINYVSALGHKTEVRNAVEPSCTEDGYTGDEVCTICGEVISQGETIEATGHHFKGNTCPDCGETRSTADTIRAWFQESFNNMKNFFDKIFGRN